MNETNYLKAKAIISIFTIVLLSMGMIFYVFYGFQQDRLDNIKSQNYDKITNSFILNTQKHLQEHYLELATQFITEEMIQAVHQNNRQELINLTYKNYMELVQQDPYITMAHFHSADGKSLLRLHNINKFGDNISDSRSMIQKIHTEQKTISGFELGESGFSYRNVIPLFYQNQYVGAFEIGISPKKVLDFVSHFNKIDGVIKFNNDKDIIKYENIKHKSIFLKLFPITNINQEQNIVINEKNEYFAVYSYDIMDINGVFIGEFIFFQDLKIYYTQFRAAISKMIFVFLVAILLLFFVLVFLFKIFTKKLVQANYELEQQKNLFSSGPVVTIEWSPEQNWPIKYVSSNCKSVLGFKPSEMMHKDFVYATLIHPNDKDRIFKEVAYNIENNINTYEQSYRLKLKDGSYKWFYDFTKLIRDNQNRLISIIGYMFDQTTLKDTQNLLYEQKQRLANIIEGTNVGTWEWDIVSKKTIFNDKWAELIGYTIEELSPTTIDTWLQFVHPDDLSVSSEALDKCFKKESDFYEAKCRMRHKNGSWIWVLDRGKVTQWDENGNPQKMADRKSVV